MAYGILGLVVVALLVYAYFRDRGRDHERDLYMKAINLAISEGAQERREFRQLLSEEWTRIQRPEIARPDLHAVEGPAPPPPEPEEAFEKVGQVYPDDNGEPDSAA